MASTIEHHGGHSWAPANDKVIQKMVKGHCHGHMFNMYGFAGRVLSKKIHFLKMKALYLRIKKVMTNDKVFQKKVKYQVTMTLNLNILTQKSLGIVLPLSSIDV